MGCISDRQLLAGGPTGTGNIFGGYLSLINSVLKFNNISTAGLGLPAEYANAKQTAVTQSSIASFLSYAPPTSAGTYLILVSASVTSATAGVVSFPIAYRDASGDNVSATAISLFQLGTAAPASSFTTSAASRYWGFAVIDINNLGTNIVVSWTGGGTLAGFASASIYQLA